MCVEVVKEGICILCQPKFQPFTYINMRQQHGELHWKFVAQINIIMEKVVSSEYGADTRLTNVHHLVTSIMSRRQNDSHGE